MYDVWICVMCAWCPQRAEEGIRFPATAVTDGYKPPWRCWELNQGPQQEQQESALNHWAISAALKS